MIDRIGKNKAISFLILVSIILGVLILAPQAKKLVEKWQQPEEEGTLVLNKYEFGKTSVATDLKREEAEKAINFIKSVVIDSLQPDEIAITLAVEEKEDSPPEYRGNWNKNGRFMSILYVPGPMKNEPQYLRIWALVTGESVDKSEVASLSIDLFKEDFVGSSGEIFCRKVSVPDIGDVTECGSLKTRDDGSLQGITIRAPIIIPEDDTKYIVVSSCLIPKEGTPFYNSDLCI